MRAESASAVREPERIPPPAPSSPEGAVQVHTYLIAKRYASHATNAMYSVSVSSGGGGSWFAECSDALGMASTSLPLRFIASSPPPHFSLHLYPEPKPQSALSYPISLTSLAMEHRSLPWLQSRKPVLTGRSAPR